MEGVAQEQDEKTFDALPKEIRAHIGEIRQRCKETMADANFSKELDATSLLRGTQELNLSDGSKIIVVDNEEICGNPIPAGNCSNRGCDLLIYKKTDRSNYRKIFDEHLHGKYIAVDYSNYKHPRFQLLVASIYAGDKRCKPEPGKDYTSGMSCNLIVTYRNGRWVWQKIE
jgi:hypothetical protein